MRAWMVVFMMLLAIAGAGCSNRFDLTDAERTQAEQRARQARAEFNRVSGATAETHAEFGLLIETAQKVRQAGAADFRLSEDSGRQNPWEVMADFSFGTLQRPGLDEVRVVLAGELVRKAEMAIDRARETGPVPMVDVERRMQDQVLEISPVGVLRRCINPFQARLRLRSTEGDTAGAVQDYERIVTMVRTSWRVPTILAQIFGQGLMHSTFRELSYEVIEGVMVPDAARCWLQALDHTPVEVDWHKVVVGERLFALAVSEEERLAWSDPAYRAQFDERDWDQKALEHSLTLALPTSKEPWLKRLLPPGFDPEAIELDMPSFEPAEGNGSPSYSVIATLAQSEGMLKARRDGLRIMLALELHKAARGAYPASLAELDLTPLGGMLPPDTLGGGAFGYRLLTNDPAGRGYLLYSLGLDAVDDGGEAQSDGDILRPETSKKDVVINAPRRTLTD